MLSVVVPCTLCGELLGVIGVIPKQLQELQDSSAQGCQVCEMLYKGIVKFCSNWNHTDEESDVEVALLSRPLKPKDRFNFLAPLEFELWWYESREKKSLNVVFYRVTGKR